MAGNQAGDGNGLDRPKWRLIFHVLGAFAAVVLAWCSFRLPETLPSGLRRPFSIRSLTEACRETLLSRYSFGYALATALTFGAIIAFVSSAQQLFTDTFHQGDRFPLLFGACAFFMACGAFANSRLVERLGTRIISHAALLALLALSAGHLLVAWAGPETLWLYIAFQAISMTCIGPCGANFAAMAMQPVGHIAATASSIQGFITATGAVAVGSLVDQAHDGTTWPLTLGYLAIALGALLIVLAVERGRLFRSGAQT